MPAARPYAGRLKSLRQLPKLSFRVVFQFGAAAPCLSPSSATPIVSQDRKGRLTGRPLPGYQTSWKIQAASPAKLTLLPGSAILLIPISDKAIARCRLNSAEVAQLAVEVASEKLAEDIVMLDLRGLAPFTDYFVIMSGNSARQLEALEEDITDAMKEAGVRRFHREGTPASGWILLDFSDIIVHIFGPEERDYFELERLWARAPQVVRIL